MMRRDPWLLVTPRDADVADLTVSLEVKEAVAVHPQHRFHLLDVHGGHGLVVPRRLEHELTRPTRRDHVEHAHALAHELALHPEVGVALGYDTDGPAGTVGSRSLLAIRGDLR